MKHLDDYSGPEISTTRDFLIRIGGKSHAGYPNYRLVQSENVLEQKGGEWQDWDDNLAPEDRARFIRKIITFPQKQIILGKEVEVKNQRTILVPGNTPIRTVTEVRLVPKYSHLDTQGWILERLYPAEAFGLPEDWYAHVVPGTDVPRLGPYPADGQYEMIAGVFLQEPSISFLEQYIAFQKARTREMQERDVRSILNDKIYAHEQQEKKKRELAEQRIRDLISPLYGTSLEAGRWRNEVAIQAGIRSHMGN